MTAALPMGSNKITGMADPTVSTDGATKNYVDTTTASFFSTGDIKLTIKATPDTGWLLFLDQTIGPTSSTATYANNNCQALYTLIWTNISQTNAPVTGGRGASAAADWAALKPIQLLRTLGRAWAMLGTGSGLTGRGLGDFIGEENHALIASELPNITPSFNGSAGTVNVTSTSNFSGQGTNAASSTSLTLIAPGGAGTITSSGTFTPTGTISGFGGNVPHNNMQPTVFVNAMVKL